MQWIAKVTFEVKISLLFFSDTFSKHTSQQITESFLTVIITVSVSVNVLTF